MPSHAYCQSAYQQKFDTTSTSELLCIHELFQQHFKVFEFLPRESPKLFEQTLALRYQVYCLENSFENASDFPSKMEMDQYDEYSVHTLICHRDTGEAVATVRLVQPNSSGYQHGFPMEPHCNASLTALPGESRPSSHHLPAEISRFAISKNVRQRVMKMASTMQAGHTEKGKPNHISWDRLLYSQFTLELFAAAIRLSDKYGITHWYSLASPALLRTLRRFGIRLTSVGPAIDHRGMRLPCIDNLETLLRRVYQTQPDAWNILTNHGTIWRESKRNYIEELKQEKIKAKDKFALLPYFKKEFQPRMASA
ncbi:PEP-CTERM/exosortase system-associated acyltransferase [Nitrosococcus oceani]|nr:PEP-CTERM/exosortase system-associated acyltransferase [Nitrosococcus oceani]